MTYNLFKPVTAIVLASIVFMPSVSQAHEVKSDRKNNVKETHDLSGFDRIDIVGVFELDVQVGDEFSVFTSGRAKDVKDMKVYVKGDSLVLDQHENSRKSIKMRGFKKNNEGILVRVTLPSLQGIDIAGVATGMVENIDSDRFTIDIAGISGGIELSGTCGRLTADMSGLGELDARDLKCEDVNVDLAGMGQISVFASQSVNADASGMGSIDVYGDPVDIEKDQNFMSSVDIK